MRRIHPVIVMLSFSFLAFGSVTMAAPDWPMYSWYVGSQWYSLSFPVSDDLVTFDIEIGPEYLCYIEDGQLNREACPVDVTVRRLHFTMGEEITGTWFLGMAQDSFQFIIHDAQGEGSIYVTDEETNPARVALSFSGEIYFFIFGSWIHVGSVAEAVTIDVCPWLNELEWPLRPYGVTTSDATIEVTIDHFSDLDVFGIPLLYDEIISGSVSFSSEHRSLGDVDRKGRLTRHGMGEIMPGGPMISEYFYSYLFDFFEFYQWRPLRLGPIRLNSFTWEMYEWIPSFETPAPESLSRGGTNAAGKGMRGLSGVEIGLA